MSVDCHLSPDLLSRLVADELPDDDVAKATAHLDECPLCQSGLQRAAGKDDWWEETAVQLRRDADDLPPARITEWSAIDFTVDFLEPAAESEATLKILGRLGDYEVHSVIGRGGMGVVVKARDPQLNRFVAIKALGPEWAASDVARRRFTREAQAAAAVVHPNVIAIHQVQPTGRLPFLVMPLIPGESLQQRLASRGPLPLVEILRIAVQTAAGLAAAHSQGLVHRDVKPANILLEPGIERVVLTDFGLARAADDHTLSLSGVIAGTPAYMSPEQSRGEPLDGRSDLFSLGCVMFEMATGRPPFQADGTLALLRKISEDDAPTPTSLRADLPPWFDRVVARLIAKTPSKRFANATEVAEVLEKCLAHVQDSANPLPAEFDEGPRQRRRRWGWGVVASLALAIAVFTIVWNEEPTPRQEPNVEPPIVVEPPAEPPAEPPFDPAWDAVDRELRQLHQWLEEFGRRDR